MPISKTKRMLATIITFCLVTTSTLTTLPIDHNDDDYVKPDFFTAPILRLN
jgi:hypothetical protein